MYQVNSPILLIIFNRPNETQLVFDAIRKVKPAKLYIAADGPRSSRLKEAELCKKAIGIVSKIDWPCNIETLYHQSNLGCKYAVSAAINWFFKNELEGIILEDDCLPSELFFEYCDTLLNKYRDDTRINHISGAKLNKRVSSPEYTYYYSRITQVWGWATWRRVWDFYNLEMTNLNDIKPSFFNNIFRDLKVSKHLYNQFNLTKNGYVDTWDYQYGFSNFISYGLSINPNFNLISNIGFNENATHTTAANSKFALQPFEQYEEMIHPRFMIPDLEGDIKYLKNQIPSFIPKLKQAIKKIAKNG